MTAGLMAGKRGLIMGVANDKSIAWGIAKACHAQGAELAFTYQGDALKKRVEPLAASVGSDIVLPCDVTDNASVEAVFEALSARWGKLDFLLHAIAYADKAELKGRYVDTSAGNFERSMNISCYSFTALAQRAETLMTDGGSLLTLTYYGAEKVSGQQPVSRTDQDPCGVGHRRFPLYPEVERAELALAPQRDPGRCRQGWVLSPVRPRLRRHWRVSPCGLRLPRRRHEG
jgi:NAD(P)-dependent dehydrogenase (short-subunit alcohol dehydrogenase family)